MGTSSWASGAEMDFLVMLFESPLSESNTAPEGIIHNLHTRVCKFVPLLPYSAISAISCLMNHIPEVPFSPAAMLILHMFAL